MKTRSFFKIITIGLALASLAASAWAESTKMTYEQTVTLPTMKMTQVTPNQITAPDKIITPAGTFEFFDGVPTKDSAKSVYDYVDRARGVEAFINMIGTVNMASLRIGAAAIGATEYYQIPSWQGLADSKSLILTGNNTSLYTWSFIDLKKDGPMVIELPADVLGFLDDMHFRYITDMGAAGPDKGKGGKYLVLPPGYKGEIPEGYYVNHSKTYGVWVLMRGYIKTTVKAAADNIANNLKIYPLAMKDNPKAMEFINMTGKEGYNSIMPNGFSYFEVLNSIIQEEPNEALDPVTLGLLASIGIVKGKPFNPTPRMRRLLTEAAQIGTAYARANTVYPRDPGHYYYPDTESEWVMAYADNDTYFLKDGGVRADSRLWFLYNAIGITPAMALVKPGAGSQYAIAGLDANHEMLDGAKTYKLHLPPNVPVEVNWSVTIYDTQTRSMLQSDQPNAGVNSLNKDVKKNKDGSYDIYISPTAPKGKESNWVQSVPEKSFFIILRAYGPKEPWLNKTWRPSDLELVK